MLGRQIINIGDPNYGAVRGGIEGGSEIHWISTEFNCDAYRALKNLGILLNDSYYINQAELIKDWIFNNAWDGQRFICGGYGDYTEVLDTQTFSFLTFAEEDNMDIQNKLRAGINWAINNLIETINYNNIIVSGFRYGRNCYWGGFYVWPQHVWWEGTAQIVKVFQLSGDQINYTKYLNHLRSVQDSNGGIIYSYCSGCSQGSQWPHNLPFNSVAASAWFYLASIDLNPFIPNFPPKLNQVRDIEINLGETVSFQLQAEDPNTGDEITYSVNGFNPKFAPQEEVINPITGEFNWIPNYAMEYNLTFIVTDSKGLFDSIAVRINVNPPYPPKPNLVIENVRLIGSYAIGGARRCCTQIAEITIRNSGDVAVPKHKYFYLAYDWDPIKRNYNCVIAVNYMCPGGIPSGGSVKFYVYLHEVFERKFYIDYWNKIDESNENDNEYSIYNPSRNTSSKGGFPWRR